MKPELLLPVGNTESLFAALDAGADAVYLGLNNFNARKRARNFTIQQLPAVISLAHKHNTKVFITLNTVIKNSELPALYQTLYQLNQIKPDAVIIQDWGVYYFLKEHFPSIPIHASTQAAFHNTLGIQFAKRTGIKRVVMARELTRKELAAVCKNSDIETEMFVHGALCYSISGMCLFSSYLGGMSANRGSCKQVCRRQFSAESERSFPFNLKDNELIGFVPELMKMGVSSLKIEGRLKSSDYVYNVGKAYRMVLDNPNNIEEAVKLLTRDTGREKTSYFFGGNLAGAITELPNTGIFSGKIEVIEPNVFEFETHFDASEISKLRISSPDGNRQETFQLKNYSQLGKKVTVTCNGVQFEQFDYVYIVGFHSKKFSDILAEDQKKKATLPSPNEIKIKAQNLVKTGRTYQPRLFLRIDTLDWLNFISPDIADFFILNLSKKEWDCLIQDNKLFEKYAGKIIPELPTFIPEGRIEFFRSCIQKLQENGIDSFVLGHISQIELFKAPAKFIASESIYAFNDAAVQQLRKFGFTGHINPLENDLSNFLSGNDRSCIVPLYYFPVLFYARMPASGLRHENDFADDENSHYRIEKRDGMTYTLPAVPVSLFTERTRLADKGFKRYLIDLSFHKPESRLADDIILKYHNCEKISGSKSFNFRRELT